MTENMNLRIKIGLIGIVILSVMKFAYFPLMDWKENALSKIHILNRSVSMKEKLVGSEKQIDGKLLEATKAYEEGLALFGHDFPDPQALQLRIQKRIENLVASRGITLKSTDWLYPSEGDIVRAPVKVRCEGTPYSIIELIKAIETDPRFLTVDRIKIVSRGQQSHFVAAEIDVSGYGVNKTEF